MKKTVLTPEALDFMRMHKRYISNEITPEEWYDYVNDYSGSKGNDADSAQCSPYGLSTEALNDNWEGSINSKKGVLYGERF